MFCFSCSDSAQHRAARFGLTLSFSPCRSYCLRNTRGLGFICASLGCHLNAPGSPLAAFGPAWKSSVISTQIWKGSLQMGGGRSVLGVVGLQRSLSKGPKGLSCWSPLKTLIKPTSESALGKHTHVQQPGSQELWPVSASHRLVINRPYLIALGSSPPSVKLERRARLRVVVKTGFENCKSLTASGCACVFVPECFAR